jgi:hypothetical protein
MDAKFFSNNTCLHKVFAAIRTKQKPINKKVLKTANLPPQNPKIDCINIF